VPASTITVNYLPIWNNKYHAWMYGGFPGTFPIPWFVYYTCKLHIPSRSNEEYWEHFKKRNRKNTDLINIISAGWIVNNVIVNILDKLLDSIDPCVLRPITPMTHSCSVLGSSLLAPDSTVCDAFVPCHASIELLSVTDVAWYNHYRLISR
jgi:hypothetical protein